jgi:hypothetical protein
MWVAVIEKSAGGIVWDSPAAAAAADGVYFVMPGLPGKIKIRYAAPAVLATE